MSVPPEIRSVDRPINTVVVCSGGGYRVRQRIGCKNVNGRRVPIEGKYIGSIVNGVYVPDPSVKKTGTTGRVDVKHFGRVKMCDLLNKDIIDMLQPIYNKEESTQIYCMAVIRACYAGTRDYQMKERYNESFLSEMYPDVSLGKNAVSAEQRNLGLEYSRIRKFMRMRVCSMDKNDTLIIDGCLKQNHSTVDTFSQISRKTSARKHKDQLMMYAYSENLREPICSKIYPGNVVDSGAIEDFINTNEIENGLIVADKGFTAKAVANAIGNRPGLHYLVPLKRNSTLIETNRMYEFDGTFQLESRIEYKKTKIEGRYLYSFRDLEIAKDEEENYLKEHAEDIDPDTLQKVRMGFGTIVFECDLDAPASKIYSVYQNRWLIELMFKFYQSGLDLDDTRVHDDYSDIGSDFIDFLATLIASRMLNKFNDIPEMATWTYKMSMDFLDKLKMVRVDDGEEWEHNKLALVDVDIFNKLGILQAPAAPFEKKKLGRPKGRKDSQPRKTRADKGKSRPKEM